MFIFLLERAHGVVVSHPLRMRKALGSNPSVSILIIIWKSGILPAVVAAIKMTTFVFPLMVGRVQFVVHACLFSLVGRAPAQ